MLASIGHNKAVADIGGRGDGFLNLARYLLNENTCISKECTFFLEWAWGMFFPPNIARMEFTCTGED
jgi:hypothetical protein